jgi:hypothetical protein
VRSLAAQGGEHQHLDAAANRREHQARRCSRVPSGGRSLRCTVAAWARLSPRSRSIGRNIKHLIDREDEPHCFRLHKERVYYVSERVMRQATSVGRDDLVALGTCFGKFTKTKKFHLKVTALDFVAQHAKVRRPADEVARGGGRRESRGGSGISPPSGAPPRAPRSTRCG